MPEQIAPVTEVLGRTMARMATVLKADRKVNDADDYAEIVNHLEDLTVSVMSATSSLTFIGVRPVGARFDIAAGTELARKVTECTVYLRNDATHLITLAKLSKFETKNVMMARDLLSGLYGLLIGGIMQQARLDLNKIRADQGPDAFIAAAAQLADMARMTD